MQTKKIIISSLIFIFVLTGIFSALEGSPSILNSELEESLNPLMESPKNSDTTYEIIDNILEDKIDQILNDGYFEQNYQSSIQATFYAISIQKTIGMTQEINTQAVINYVMLHYDSDSDLFEDRYSERYLDANFSLII